MRTLIATTILFTSCARSTPVTPGFESWSHHRAITVAAPAAELVDVPVLLRLDLEVTSAARPDGRDLRVVDRDGELLALDIDSWEDGVVWVRVPLLTPGATTELRLYWDNPDAQPLPGSSWSEAFVAVWHLNGLSDSTDHGNDGIDHGSTAASGYIGAGRHFDRAFIEVTDHPSLHGFTELTLSAWARRDLATDNWEGIITRGVGATPTNGLYLGFWGNRHLGTIGDTLEHRVQGAVAPTDTWSHATVTWDSETIRLYVDGVEDTTTPFDGTMDESANPVLLGADSDTGGASYTDWFTGVIDEARIENVARSPEWIAFQVATMTGDAVTFGPVEPL